MSDKTTFIRWTIGCAQAILIKVLSLFMFFSLFLNLCFDEAYRSDSDRGLLILKLVFWGGVLLGASIVLAIGTNKLLECYGVKGRRSQDIYLSESDNEYINLVCSCIDKWDISVQDCGDELSISRISFFNFANDGRIVFFVNYPNGEYCGYFLHLDDNSMEIIDVSQGDNTAKLWCKRYSSYNEEKGIYWNTNAAYSEKNSMIKDAYSAFLKETID